MDLTTLIILALVLVLIVVVVAMAWQWRSGGPVQYAWGIPAIVILLLAILVLTGNLKGNVGVG